ncbi:hypothetical protein CONCODRAFT_13076 [Conidiobolus coronatus NRRL 28638]|uniref:Uncharacterized protein n=1 Tax=Conidiobolus coronatus (strain ATCC 28846 / CBS 209.66 / NRRL 28638) TaxID=796925 RepID=A0A137NRG6_CONC2|nr:hypothetical protein CONCODRAFT_13076 [Conidiobolus coronatus NRRL 28638]|eukprot:KXN65359.1 hypothetical protein CONCODRAFT_13076 [Conidiobolus coronatus NRRL 28638]
MQFKDNIFSHNWNNDTSYKPKTAVYSYGTFKGRFCANAVSDYVDLSTCGGCEESHSIYSRTWSIALLGPNDRAAEIYDLCRKINDCGDGYMEAVRELKGKLNNSEEWEQGLHDFLACVEDDNFEVDIHYNDDEYLDRAYRYGAFKGVLGTVCCDPNKNRLAEMAACLVHSGMKCVCAGEKRKTKPYWVSNFTAAWHTGYNVGDRIREMSFFRAVLGVLCNENVKVGNKKADQALQVCILMARLTDSPDHRILAKAAAQCVAIRSRNSGP